MTVSPKDRVGADCRPIGVARKGLRLVLGCRPQGDHRRMRMSWLFGRSNVRAPWIVALLVLINALLLRALDPTGLTRLGAVAFDSFQRLKPRTYHPATPVRIVDIDEAALAEFGQVPRPRPH